MSPIPYGRQDISEADIAAVVNVLRSDFLTQGPAVPAFESAVAGYCGAKHAVAVNSATSALHIACLALGLGSGDWLWTSPNSFVASANCALYCGAKVDFVDIDPRTYNISVDALRQKLENAERTGHLPKVVVPVHFAGQACAMREIAELAAYYGFHVIEDASHAIGGSYREEPIGNCRHSDITVFSFHPVKIITCGEGGVAMTNNPALAEKMRLIRSHGITRDPARLHGKSEGAWYYQQITIGYNYRMTDLQAALGSSQMTRLDEFVQQRRSIAAKYQESLAQLPITNPWQHADSRSAFHLYPILVSGAKNKRKEIFDRLREAGIAVNVHYIPVHTQPYYQQLGFKAGDFPEAERYYAREISLPIYPTLSQGDFGRVVSTLNAAFQI